MCDRTAWQRMAAVTVMMLVGAATAFAQDRPREPRRDGPPRPEVAQKDTKNDDVIAQLREEVLRLRHQLEAFQSQGQKPGDRDGKAAPDRGTAARPEARGSRDEGKEEGSRMNRGSWGRQQGPMAGGSEGWGNRGRGMFGGRDGFRGQAGPSPMAGGQNAVVQARELLEQAKALILALQKFVDTGEI